MGQVIEFFHHKLGFNGLFLCVSQGSGRLPFFYLFEPWLPASSETAQFLLAQKLIKFLKRDSAIPLGLCLTRDGPETWGVSSTSPRPVCFAGRGLV